MELISTTNFALEQYGLYEEDQITAETYANRVKNYALFLSQPLIPDFFIGPDQCRLLEGFKNEKNVTSRSISKNGVFHAMWYTDELGWSPAFGLGSLENLTNIAIELTPTAQKLFL